MPTKRQLLAINESKSMIIKSIYWCQSYCYHHSEHFFQKWRWVCRKIKRHNT